MAQTWVANCFDPNNSVQSDVQAMENNFEALRTNFGGSGAPANPVAGMVWSHPGGVDGARFRNVDNSAWLAFILGDANTKLWMYRNDASPGMEVDTTVTDKVLSIKGGAQAYNVDGGGTAGSWTITGITSNNTGGHAHTGNGRTQTGTASVLTQSASIPPKIISIYTYAFTTSTNGAHAHVITHAGTSRPAAAVGTLQKPVLT